MYTIRIFCWKFLAESKKRVRISVKVKKAHLMAKHEHFLNILLRIYGLFSRKFLFAAVMGTEKKFFAHFSDWKLSQLQEKLRFFDFESFYKKLEQYIYIYMHISEFSFQLVPMILVDFSFTEKVAINCFGECYKI